MKLSTIFEYLTYNTLSNLAIGGKPSGEVALDNYPQLIALTNAGLLDLYTRFPLRMREIVLQLQEGRTIYRLHSDFAESNIVSTEFPKYLIDGTTVYPFNDNIIVLDSVWDEIGEELPLNDATKTNSVFTPSPIELQVPEANGENAIVLIYRALPDVISLSVIDTTIVEVDLPFHFMDALTSFIAWKLYTPLDGGSREQQTGQVHHAAYLAAINLIKQEGSVLSDTYTNQRFEVNGWR